MVPFGELLNGVVRLLHRRDDLVELEMHGAGTWRAHKPTAPSPVHLDAAPTGGTVRDKG